MALNYSDNPVNVTPDQPLILTELGNFNYQVLGTDGNDTVVSTGGNDSIVTGGGDDLIFAGGGRDTIESTSGNDTIDAGNGFDVVKLGLITDYLDDNGDLRLAKGENGAWIATRDDGTQATIYNAEQLVFTGEPNTQDTVVSFVENSEDATGLYLYEALLGRAADSEGAEFWLDQLDHDNVSLTDIANGFLASEEFSTKNGSDINNDDFIDLLYENLLGREARLDSDGKAFWFDQLEAGADRAELVVDFIETAMANDAEQGIAQIIVIGDDQA